MELYIHIPFCVKKCNYCDFLSFPSDDETIEAYFKALRAEAELSTLSYGNIPVSSVFIGGGTPSSVDASYIKALMENLRIAFDIKGDAEITIETNPGTLDRKKLETYKDCGINRLSMGLQATHEKELCILGRIHNYEIFVHNYKLARETGFDNINVDLMSAIPGQTLSEWRENLDRVIELGPEHISAYSLIVEEETPFWDQYSEGMPFENDLPDEEIERQMYYLTEERLSEAGYHRYEISNYALDGYECAHNKGYWTREEYLGLGLGAASLINNVRWNNTRDMKEYLLLHGPKEVQMLTKEEIMSEYMFLGLRLTKGICEADFQRQFGCSLRSVYAAHTDRMINEGLLEEKDGRLRLTKRGTDFASLVMCGFV